MNIFGLTELEYIAFICARSFADMFVQLALQLLFQLLLRGKRGRKVDHAAGCDRGVYRAGKEGRNEGKRRKPVRGKEKKKREKEGGKKEGEAAMCAKRGGQVAPSCVSIVRVKCCISVLFNKNQHKQLLWENTTVIAVRFRVTVTAVHFMALTKINILPIATLDDLINVWF